MKTVKQFRDAGLVFVDGDRARDAFGNELSDMHLTQRSSCIELYTNDTCTEFAWRPLNTLPSTLKFKVELKGNNGNIRTLTKGTDLRLTNDKSSNGAYFAWLSWRPVISDAPEIKIINNTSDCDVTIGKLELEGFNSRCVMVDLKPTYTQEMHDAGELPPIGSKFMLAKQINCQRLDQFQGAECTVIGHCKNLDGDDVITFSDPSLGYACMRHLPEFIKPIDTRTYEEKNLYEWLLVMSKSESTSLDEKAKATLKWLEVNGYRKQQEK